MELWWDCGVGFVVAPSCASSVRESSGSLGDEGMLMGDGGSGRLEYVLMASSLYGMRARGRFTILQ